MKKNTNHGSALIGVLVAIILIGVIAVIYFGKAQNNSKIEQLTDQNSTKKTTVGKSMDTAKAVDCQQRLRQIRMAIENYKATGEDGEVPPDLKSLDMGVSGDYTVCPVSNKPYTYNSETGTVMCTTHTDY